MTKVLKENRISTAVVLKGKNSDTRIAYMEKSGRIVGKGYNTLTGEESLKSFSSIQEAKDWVHEIAPENAIFSNSAYSLDHFDNIGSNRRDFEEMWKIHHEPEDIVQLLNGSETYFNRTVGYCAYHKRYLTKTQLKTKGCLQKSCDRLIKIESSFWKSRDSKQVEKKIERTLSIV